MKTSPILSAFLLLGFLGSPLHSEEAPPSIFTGFGSDVSLTDSTTRILLARVDAVETDPVDPTMLRKFPYRITYRTSVLCEFRDAARDGSEVMISGQAGLQGSHPIAIPIVNKGDIVLFAARATNDPKNVEYAGAITLPIGIALPCTVSPKEVTGLAEGLRMLGAIVRGGAAPASDEDARKLQLAPSYYVWAIGTTSLALNGRPDGIDLLKRAMTEEKITGRQAYWIDHCFNKVVPHEARPSVEERYALLRAFVRRTYPK